MDRAALDELQMQGQDIPWLLGHWATTKPDHPALIWEPPSGAVRTWTWAELLDATQGLAAGLRDRGITRGDKVLIHADNAPEMLLVWLACATVGAVAVTTNTRSAPAEIAYFVAVWQKIAIENGAPKGASGGLYLTLLLIRCAAIAYLGFQAARAAWRPWHDPVRVPDDPVDTSRGEDDPAGGVLAMQPDRVVVRLG